MPEAHRVAVREVGGDVFGQLEVPLGADDAHVPEVGGQRRQEISGGSLLAIPQGQAKDGERVAVIPISE